MALKGEGGEQAGQGAALEEAPFEAALRAELCEEWRGQAGSWGGQS